MAVFLTATPKEPAEKVKLTLYGPVQLSDHMLIYRHFTK